MFVKLSVFFLLGCFAAWGQTKYLPFEGEDLDACLRVVNQMNSLNKKLEEKNFDKEGEKEIHEKKRALFNEIETLGKKSRNDFLPALVIEKPDLSKLPLIGWTERELMSAAENGNGAACMQLAYIWIRQYKRDDDWAVYTQVYQWLSLAQKYKQPGADFLWNLLLTPPDSLILAKEGNPYQNIPGFEEYNRLLEGGDELACKIVQELRCFNINGEEWLREAYLQLEHKAKEGDREAQRHCVIWLCEKGHYERNGNDYLLNNDLAKYSNQELEGIREKRLKWFDQLCEEGNMEARYYWLTHMLGREICTAGYLEKVIRYAVELHNAGYAPACDESFFRNVFKAKLDVWDFVAAVYPMTDLYQLEHDRRDALYARGLLNELKFGPHGNERNGKIITNKELQDCADECIAIGSGCLFEDLLKRYHYHAGDNCNFLGYREKSDFLFHSTVKPLVEKGVPGAMQFMAISYMQGILVEQDILKALDLWERALAVYEALDGKNAFDFRNSLFEIRVNLEHCRMKLAGDDEKQKQEIARRLQELEKETQDAMAHNFYFKDAGRETLNFLLGYMYETGYGVPVDVEKAASCYERASDIPEALNNLGLMYEEGRGVGRDLKKAAGLFREVVARKNGKVSENAGRNLERIEVIIK